MAQKVIDVVGTSKESFAKAVEKRGGKSRKDGSRLEVARVSQLERG
jgi:flavin-binding protein dodecin